MMKKARANPIALAKNILEYTAATAGVTVHAYAVILRRIKFVINELY